MNVFQLECYYCDKGKVSFLPSRCSECDRVLTKPFDSMTPQEQSMAWLGKVTGMTKETAVEIALAS